MVSVIIPLYNRANLISFTLQSLLPENHPSIDLEVFVIDDASSDNGTDIVQKNFPHVSVMTNSVNKGASACRNQGISLAKGEFIFFLDSDDIVEPGFFGKRLSRLMENRQLSGVYGPWTHFESDASYHESQIRPRKSAYPLYDEPTRDAALENLLLGWFIPINATVWKTQSVRDAGGFTEGLQINQDVDFGFRLLLTGLVCGVHAPRALIRIHKGERVGQVTSETRLQQMLELRKRFMHDLEKHGMLEERYKQATGSYAFDLWSLYRKEYPKISAEFLILSRALHPGLKLKGTRWLRLIASLMGNANAVKFKQWAQRK